MQNQHQTFHHLLFSGCYILLRSILSLYTAVENKKGGRVPTIKYKTQHCVRERGKLILTQSHGLTDEFMCALINWFTQRLLHVDITLVQGLKVDFYYDKLLMAEWIVTAADSTIDFCVKQKQSRRLWSDSESSKSFFLLF